MLRQTHLTHSRPGKGDENETGRQVRSSLDALVLPPWSTGRQRTYLKFLKESLVSMRTLGLIALPEAMDGDGPMGPPGRRGKE